MKTELPRDIEETLSQRSYLRSTANLHSNPSIGEVKNMSGEVGNQHNDVLSSKVGNEQDYWSDPVKVDQQELATRLPCKKPSLIQESASHCVPSGQANPTISSIGVKWKTMKCPECKRNIGSNDIRLVAIHLAFHGVPHSIVLTILKKMGYKEEEFEQFQKYPLLRVSKDSGTKRLAKLLSSITTKWKTW